MTTEAKLKKLEEDQIILEDQNCKLAKVRRGGCRGRAELGRGHGGRVTQCRAAAARLSDGSAVASAQ